LGSPSGLPSFPFSGALKMKVKLLTSRAGVGESQNAGDEIEVSAAEGGRMIEAGQATLVRSIPIKQNTSKKFKTEKANKV
jgi:hypothetical protein